MITSCIFICTTWYTQKNQILGWVEPLLERIAQNSSNVVTPVIDTIDLETLQYHLSSHHRLSVGGFNWGLVFNWHLLPDRDYQAMKSRIDPVPSVFILKTQCSHDFVEKARKSTSIFAIKLGHKLWMAKRICIHSLLALAGVANRNFPENNRNNQICRSPTMAGGLFSIDRAYFEKLGGYDPGFDIWGGENLEISFKVRMSFFFLSNRYSVHVQHCGNFMACRHDVQSARGQNPSLRKPGLFSMFGAERAFLLSGQLAEIDLFMMRGYIVDPILITGFAVFLRWKLSWQTILKKNV